MAVKFVFLCVSSILIQIISCQYQNVANPGTVLLPSGVSAPSLQPSRLSGLQPASLAGVSGYTPNQPNQATYGGQFLVQSSSPIAVRGLSVFADNLQIEGPLAIEGQLPLIGAVAVEGQLPTVGQAETSYGCGNGNVGIISETLNGNSVNAYGSNVGPDYPNRAGSGVYGLGTSNLIGNRPGYVGNAGSNFIGNGIIGSNMVANQGAVANVPSVYLAAAQASASANAVPTAVLY